MPTRRTVIASGASMALLAGCGGRSPRKLAGSVADIPAIAERLKAERFGIAVIQASLTRLNGDAAATARTILEHDHEHAEALAEAIRELSGKPEPAQPPIPEGIGLDALITLKERTSRAYEHAIPSLANTRLRGTFGALMTVEAEHAMALRLAR
jgi:rubrerythrin